VGFARDKTGQHTKAYPELFLLTARTKIDSKTFSLGSVASLYNEPNYLVL